MPPTAPPTLTILYLKHHCAHNPRNILNLFQTLISRIDTYPDPAVWIHRLPHAQIDWRLTELLKTGPTNKTPLWGIPFAVKDNIDVAGIPTTAACPSFAYTPSKSATVVTKLLEAGAVFLGKTNMDQFATGLVGTRSPYGACRNTYNPAYISGGSSSGSAVAVAAGLVSFALGTDTAGSGRVPAAFNNIVGYKPTPGLISTAGVVPACRSLDCVSIFARNSEDAQNVAAIAAGHDPDDPYSRTITAAREMLTGPFRFGVPQPGQLKFFGNGEYERLFHLAVQHMNAIGGTPVTIDYVPFARAAALLYQGPWIAERQASFGAFVSEHPTDVIPIIRDILSGAARFSATDVFLAQHELANLRMLAEREWRQVDVLLLPTAGTIYRHDEIEREPISLNTNLGYYTNFVNLMNLCALAVPAGFTEQRLPFGITLIGRAGDDSILFKLANRFVAATQCDEREQRK